MSFDIFDEEYYLATNPDVANAVEQGFFNTGFDHFRFHGYAEGRVSVSPLYDEDLYLQANPDVANAVAFGFLESGLVHYMLYGENEGRFGLYGAFNEQAYLTRYPDVANAVDAGFFESGFAHFTNFGVDEGRFDALYNEEYYLQKYPDVANAVAFGFFESGLQHYLNHGLGENRSGGTFFNEGFYLRDNPDVASAVAQGFFSSGLAHFAQFGEAEGRSGTSFDEGFYRLFNPDVNNAIQAGAFSSGEDHYRLFGQFESQRIGFFTGTDGNDVIASFGNNSELVGVGVDLNRSVVESLGTGEIDYLIGGSATDTYNLGITDAIGTDKLYVGFGDADYALIRSFDIETDYIRLAGSVNEYTQQVVNGSLNISTTFGDLIGIVEGYGQTLSVFTSEIPGTFLLGWETWVISWINLKVRGKKRSLQGQGYESDRSTMIHKISHRP